MDNSAGRGQRVSGCTREGTYVHGNAGRGEQILGGIGKQTPSSIGGGVHHGACLRDSGRSW